MSRTLLPTLVVLAVLAGVGSFTFRYGQGLSYLSTDPQACRNCHIMNQQFDSWQKSSHHMAASCVDCHLPHGFVGKYLAKAENGYKHSKAFTLQNFHEPIMITPKNSRILQENCIACHADMVHMITENGVPGNRDLACVHCHLTVGHGEPAGLGGPLLTEEYQGARK